MPPKLEQIRGSQAVHQITVRLFPADVAAINYLMVHCKAIGEIQGAITPSAIIRWAIHQVVDGILNPEKEGTNHGQEREERADPGTVRADATGASQDD